MSDFSKHTALRGLLAPARFEADVYDCEVSGAIPADLDGAFYRMHGDWLYPPKYLDDISLAADGYVSSFRFRNGLVDYKGRYVRTDRFERQMQARRQLYGYYRNPYTDEPQVQDIANPGLRTTANTTPVSFNGQLLATKEDGLPYRLDPRTLATLGPTDFEGQWQGQAFTAHPKLDPRSGELVAFGYEADGLASRQVLLGSFAKHGQLQWQRRFDVPYTSMLHDMALTPQHALIVGGGGVTSLERIKAGKLHWAWNSSLPSYYGIVPRNAADPIRWFSGPERSIVHTANAYVDGNKVVLIAPMANGNTWPWFEDLAGKPFAMPPTTLRRVTFDLDGNAESGVEEVLFDRPITSFTRIDERFTTLPFRYVFVQFADGAQAWQGALPDDPRQQPVNSIGRFDLQTMSMKSLFVGAHHIVQEPCFVPRPGSNAEGDGYLLATVHNLQTQRSELLIVDAREMLELARVLLPFRTAAQVHGIWADVNELPM